MTISNEFSSEIAAAVLAASNKSRHELRDLKDLVAKAQLVLQELTIESSAYRNLAIESREKDQRES